MEGVPIQEAAQRLGITVEAVRKRARRGSLIAHKADGLWYIILPDELADMPEPGRDTGRATGRDGHDAPKARPDGPGDTITLDLVESLREELKALHGQLVTKDQQLSEKDRQIEQLHILLQTAQQNEQRLLSATVPETVESRQSAQNDGTQARVPESPKSSPGGVQRESAPPGRRRGWLSRLFGVE
jgi:hypothetical protein